jgi:predicted acylesterase/phospholipase RssA
MDVAYSSERRDGGRPWHPPGCDHISLVLQGGGALGAYQAGVYQALHEAGLWPDSVAGVSIGGINSAIIAGNRPERRLEKLREFWETVTSGRSWALSARRRRRAQNAQYVVVVDGDCFRSTRFFRAQITERVDQSARRPIRVRLLRLRAIARDTAPADRFRFIEQR